MDNAFWQVIGTFPVSSHRWQHAQLWGFEGGAILWGSQATSAKLMAKGIFCLTVAAGFPNDAFVKRHLQNAGKCNL